MKRVSIYRSDKNGKEYYEVYCDNLGLSATIHSFDVFKDGIITILKTKLTHYEVRQKFNEYKGTNHG